MSEPRPRRLEIGLQVPHIGDNASATFVRDFAQAADELGFDGLWVADHVVVPRHADSLYTLASPPAPPPDGGLSAVLGTNLECFSTLAFLAAATTRVRLGTSVNVVPLRHPLLTATMLATIDAYSGGRVVYGAGAGWLREEAELLGMPWDHRGARVDECITLLRTVWSAPGPHVEFTGDYYTFPQIDPRPFPAQRGGPPILIGGHSDAALQRAGRLGDGWIASRMSPTELIAGFGRVRATATACGRDPGALRLHTNVDFSPAKGLRGFAVVDRGVAAGRVTASGTTPREPHDEIVRIVQEYANAGVHHLKLSARLAAPADELAWLEELAEHVLPHVRS